MITEDARLLKITTPLGPNALLLTHFSGSERLSTPFCFQLTVFSTNTKITAKQLLNKTVTVTLGNPTMPTRVFNGIVTEFKQGSIDTLKRRQYFVTLEPWYKAFSLTSDCRIFQGKTVPQIFTTVCKAQGFSHYDISQLKNHYQPLPYCVQYNETTLAFLDRILASAGIFYYFEHTDQAHTLVLADQSGSLPKLKQNLIYRTQHPTEQHIDRWQRNDQIHTTQVMLRDYNFTEPEKPIDADASLGTQPNINGLENLIWHNYPGFYQSTPEAEKLAKQTSYALAWQAHQVSGNSNYPTLEPGYQFVLSEHDDAQQLGDYVTLSVHHYAEDMSHVAEKPQQHQVDNKTTPPVQQYHNQFTCIPSLYPYVPMPNIAKPKLQGHHVAKVVGPKNNEIYTDQYNRVKVQFEWDRYGQNNENSSCWLRVNQALSGGSWGTQFIPRVGDEVNVAFINGDPDRPIITGSAYNANNAEPFNLPTNANISGITTHIIGSQDPQQGHKCHFDDTPNKELLTLHSEKQLTQVINNNLNRQIGGSDNTVINGKQTIVAQSGKGEMNAQSMHFQVGQNSVRLDSDGITIKDTGSAQMPNISQSPTNLVVPSAEASIEPPTQELIRQLPPYTVQTRCTLKSTCSLTNNQSVNPLTFDREGFKVQAKQEAANIFTNLEIKSYKIKHPSITLGNNFGNYALQMEPSVITPNIMKYTVSAVKPVKGEEGDWRFSGTANFNLEVTITKNPQSSPSELTTLLDDLKEHVKRSAIELDIIGSSILTATATQVVIRAVRTAAPYAAAAAAG